ncbi:MAG TPA: hypothetical protein VGQ93_05370, partial [Lysobacter sp.]|nr:hypothetical protein [Lysobacter sp.]
MRKTLLTAMIAGALFAPVAYAQVGVNIGGGAGVGVNTGPVGVGVGGRTDIGAGVDTRDSRIDTHRTRARADVR